jgi:hypothetical protein
MAISYNPRIVTDGLVLALDVANKKCISPIGCTGFNNAPQLLKNLVSTSDTINSYNGIKLGNLSYYTAFAIDYPESSYGGDAALRQGITPGYNVRSGTKTFDFGRALNYAVYNNPTQSWVKTTVYDTYPYLSEVERFVSEYATAVATYPDAVHVVAGSHRDSNHTTAQYDILRDLGAPSNVDSIIGFSSPEWILVGEPGLGAGNAYGWVFQNYSTDPNQVAHLNFGLPIYGTKDNYLEFDGTDDYIDCGTFFNYQTFTIELWVNPGTTQTTYADIFDNNHTGFQNFVLQQNASDLNNYAFGVIDGSGSISATGTIVLTANTWTHLAFTFSPSTRVIAYVNGAFHSQGNLAGGRTINYVSPNLSLGRWSYGNSRFWNGKMSSFKSYNRILTASEVQQNFNATRSRFSI